MAVEFGAKEGVRESIAAADEGPTTSNPALESPQAPENPPQTSGPADAQNTASEAGGKKEDSEKNKEIEAKIAEAEDELQQIASAQKGTGTNPEAKILTEADKLRKEAIGIINKRLATLKDREDTLRSLHQELSREDRETIQRLLLARSAVGPQGLLIQSSILGEEQNKKAEGVGDFLAAMQEGTSQNLIASFEAALKTGGLSEQDIQNVFARFAESGVGGLLISPELQKVTDPDTIIAGMFGGNIRADDLQSILESTGYIPEDVKKEVLAKGTLGVLGTLIMLAIGIGGVVKPLSQKIVASE